MICPTCQTENAEGSQFCASCGNTLSAGVLGMANTLGLAGRGSRLIASIIDGVIFVALLLIGGWIHPSLGLIAFVVFIIVQVVLLTKDGQTVGKKALNVRIVKMDTNENGGFVPNVLLRLVLNGLIGIIPLYGLVDVLFIFREDRRCIHDMIAGTQVVKA